MNVLLVFVRVRDVSNNSADSASAVYLIFLDDMINVPKNR
jgi:hypothetical protein